ncbi:MAG: flap structure-specific endonuclease, partial [Candidatus Diapherotrites archaeon]|nr:flap structure-specific endonuclease [Candidatus Diapherotrites archaeon]
MGVQISELVTPEKIDLKVLQGRKIAIDAFNSLYQFLAIIRQFDGTPLMDSAGNITSQYSGLFYRTIKLVEAGIKPVYVFDGEPPILKFRTIQERRQTREKAEKKWKEAQKKGDMEAARKYAQASMKLTGEMIEGSKKLLEAMGIPWVQAPSEGEAQAAHM